MHYRQQVLTITYSFARLFPTPKRKQRWNDNRVWCLPSLWLYVQSLVEKKNVGQLFSYNVYNLRKHYTVTVVGCRKPLTGKPDRTLLIACRTLVISSKGNRERRKKLKPVLRARTLGISSPGFLVYAKKFPVPSNYQNWFISWKNVVSHVKRFSDLNRLQQKQKMILMFSCLIIKFR